MPLKKALPWLPIAALVTGAGLLVLQAAQVGADAPAETGQLPAPAVIQATVTSPPGQPDPTPLPTASPLPTIDAAVVLGQAQPVVAAQAATATPTPVTSSPAGETSSNDGGRQARLSELLNEVLARQYAGANFIVAFDGTVIEVGGQAQTGDASRARLDLTEGTIVRLDENSLFELIELPQNQNLFTRLRLAIGRIWITLSGGSMEVETPNGLAAVRGSLLGVSYNPETGTTTVTCLEGTCSVSANGETITIPQGQQAVIFGLDAPPVLEGQIDDSELQAWLDNNPEAKATVLALTGTVTPSATASVTATASATSEAQAGPPPSATPVPIPATVTKLWLGNSTNWFDATNWQAVNGGVPGTPTMVDNVFLPPDAVAYPVLTGSPTINDLSLAPGATLNTNGYNVFVGGNLDAGTTITGPGLVKMTGTGVFAVGRVSNLEIVSGADVMLLGGMQVDGDATVYGTLKLMGFMLNVTGNYTEGSGADVQMSSPADRVRAGGNVSLDSGDSSGHVAGRIEVGGTLSVGAGYSPGGTHTLAMVGSGPQSISVAAETAINALEIANTGGDLVSLSSYVDVSGDVTVLSGVLWLQGNSLNVGGNFSTMGTGSLKMEDINSLLYVSGNIDFLGGSTVGQLTAGVIEIDGNFTEGGSSPGAFSASGTHIVQTVGSDPQTISVSAAGGATFANLEALGSGGTTLAVVINITDTLTVEQDLTIQADITAGTLASTSDSSPTISSTTGDLLTVTGLDTVGLTLDNVRLKFTDGASFTQFENVVFSGYGTNVDVFTIERSTGSIDILDTDFATLITPGAGHYMVATDSDASPDLAVTVCGAAPAVPEFLSHILEQNGASISHTGAICP